jgi:glycosyltransferase involved in cell wall biosynthesis
VEQKKIRLVRNALSRRPPSPDVDGEIIALARSRPTILVAGQIAPFKGTHLAVDAVLQLLREGFDVQALVLGDLPAWPEDLVEYTAQLRARVAAASAGDRVHFVGVRENILEIMKASYVLAAPILQEETFGNVALEARSVGLPVVTFARGGLPELVEHGQTGYVSRSADLEGLLAGLRLYLTNRAERDAASRKSLCVTSSPDNDCTAPEFQRRWWTIFSASALVHDADLVAENLPAVTMKGPTHS